MRKPRSSRIRSAAGYNRLALLACFATFMLTACARESQEILQRPQVMTAVVNGMKILRESQKQDSLQVVVKALIDIGSSVSFVSADTKGVDSLERPFVLLEIRRMIADQCTPTNVRRAAEAFSELYRYGNVGYFVRDGGKIIEILFLRYGHHDHSVFVHAFVMDSLARTSVHSALINELSVPRTDSFRLFYHSYKWDRVVESWVLD